MLSMAWLWLLAVIKEEAAQRCFALLASACCRTDASQTDVEDTMQDHSVLQDMAQPLGLQRSNGPPPNMLA